MFGPVSGRLARLEVSLTGSKFLVRFSGVVTSNKSPRRSRRACDNFDGNFVLARKESYVQVNNFPSLCFSLIFVIPKRVSGLRVILNLEQINLYITL